MAASPRGVAVAVSGEGQPFGWSKPVIGNNYSDDVIAMWVGQEGVERLYSFGSSGDDKVRAIVIGAQTVVVGGIFTTLLEPKMKVGPNLSLPGHYMEDGFVVGLDENLERPLWGYAIGGEGHADAVEAVAAAADGTVVAVGRFQETVEIGPITLKAPPPCPSCLRGPTRGFVVLFRPD